MAAMRKTDVLFWLKLYHSSAYECFNLYDCKGRLIGFVPKECGSRFEPMLGLGHPSRLEDAHGMPSMLKQYRYHVLIDPKRPECLKGSWADLFAALLCLNVYNSLGCRTKVFRSPPLLWCQLGKCINTRSKRILNVGSGVDADVGEYFPGCKSILSLDCIRFPSRGDHPCTIRRNPWQTVASPASFDVVLCVFVLEHVGDLQECLTGISRALVARGDLLIAVPVFWISEKCADTCSYFNPPFIHLRLFSCKAIAGLDWVIPLPRLHRTIVRAGFSRVHTFLFDWSGSWFRPATSHGEYQQLYAVSHFKRTDSAT